MSQNILRRNFLRTGGSALVGTLLRPSEVFSARGGLDSRDIAVQRLIQERFKVWFLGLFFVYFSKMIYFDLFFYP